MPERVDVVRPVQVLERQVNLVQWWRGLTGVQYADTFLRVSRQAPAFASLFSGDWDGAFFAEREAHRLDRAETFWLSDEMKRVTRKVASSMPPEALRDTDLPARTGFVWFETPVRVTDTRTHTDLVAVLWGPARIAAVEAAHPTMFDGVQLSFYTNEWGGDAVSDIGIATTLFAAVPWAFGHSCFDAVPDDSESWRDDSRAEVFEVLMRRFMAAFWRLTQQKITTTTPYRADRATRRRMERSGGLVLNQDTVKIVTLRKAAQRHHDPEHVAVPVDWSHRWMVDSYWAVRHTKDGPRQTLVSPHIKGPDHKPLVIKDRVYKVVR